MYPNLKSFTFIEARLINFRIIWLCLGHWNSRRTRQCLKFFLILTNIGKLHLGDMFEDQQMLSWIFSPSDSMLVIKFVPDGIKNCIRNCKNLLKKSFWNTVLCQKLSKKAKQVKIPRGKHIKPCFLNYD